MYMYMYIVFKESLGALEVYFGYIAAVIVIFLRVSKENYLPVNKPLTNFIAYWLYRVHPINHDNRNIGGDRH